MLQQTSAPEIGTEPTYGGFMDDVWYAVQAAGAAPVDPGDIFTHIGG